VAEVGACTYGFVSLCIFFLSFDGGGGSAGSGASLKLRFLWSKSSKHQSDKKIL
jgi:hypothetical protein